MLIHVLTHFMGLAKAFGYGNITQLTKNISKPAGLIWFVTAALFVTAIILYLIKKESWAIIAAVLSQILIIVLWKDARFGTIANIIVLLAALPAIANARFNKMVKEDTVLLLSQPAKSGAFFIFCIPAIEP